MVERRELEVKNFAQAMGRDQKSALVDLTFVLSSGAVSADKLKLFVVCRMQ